MAQARFWTGKHFVYLQENSPFFFTQNGWLFLDNGTWYFGLHPLWKCPSPYGMSDSPAIYEGDILQIYDSHTQSPLSGFAEFSLELSAFIARFGSVPRFLNTLQKEQVVISGTIFSSPSWLLKSLFNYQQAADLISLLEKEPCLPFSQLPVSLREQIRNDMENCPGFPSVAVSAFLSSPSKPEQTDSLPSPEAIRQISNICLSNAQLHETLESMQKGRSFLLDALGVLQKRNRDLEQRLAKAKQKRKRSRPLRYPPARLEPVLDFHALVQPSGRKKKKKKKRNRSTAAPLSAAAEASVSSQNSEEQKISSGALNRPDSETEKRTEISTPEENMQSDTKKKPQEENKSPSRRQRSRKKKRNGDGQTSALKTESPMLEKEEPLRQEPAQLSDRKPADPKSEKNKARKKRTGQKSSPPEGSSRERKQEDAAGLPSKRAEKPRTEKKPPEVCQSSSLPASKDSSHSGSKESMPLYRQRQNDARQDVPENVINSLLASAAPEPKAVPSACSMALLAVPVVEQELFYGAVVVENEKTHEILFESTIKESHPTCCLLTLALQGLTAADVPVKLCIKTASPFFSYPFTQGWLPKWIEAGGIKQNGQPVLFFELWEELYLKLEACTVSWQLISEDDSDPLLKKAASLLAGS